MSTVINREEAVAKNGKVNGKRLAEALEVVRQLQETGIVPFSTYGLGNSQPTSTLQRAISGSKRRKRSEQRPMYRVEG